MQGRSFYRAIEEGHDYSEDWDSIYDLKFDIRDVRDVSVKNEI